jgi:TatD DNase family protein
VLDAFKTVPPDRLLLETDSPDMLPPEEFITHPLPDGQNHPANLPRIAAALAAALETSPHHLAEITTANHARFFPCSGRL